MSHAPTDAVGPWQTVKSDQRYRINLAHTITAPAVVIDAILLANRSCLVAQRYQYWMTC